MSPNSNWVIGVSFPINQMEVQYSIALAVLVMLVLAVVSCASLSNVMSCMLKPVQQPSWFRNNIFVDKRKAQFPLLVIHENASVVASNNQLEQLCHAGSNSSDTGGGTSSLKMLSSASSICHSKLSKAS